MVLVQRAWQDPFTWPLLVFLLSCCLYPLASSCAHTFSTMSARARHICFFFDYGALSFYSLGAPPPPLLPSPPPTNNEALGPGSNGQM